MTTSVEQLAEDRGDAASEPTEGPTAWTSAGLSARVEVRVVGGLFAGVQYQLQHDGYLGAMVDLAQVHRLHGEVVWRW